MEIRISGRVQVFEAASGTRLTAPSELKKLDGLTYDEDLCSNYLTEPPLDEIGLEGGSLRLVYDPGARALRVLTLYQSPRALQPDELRALVDQTLAQWSDGIGEGCFDTEAQARGVQIDLFPLGEERDVRYEQVPSPAGGEQKKRSTRLFKGARTGDLELLRKALDAGEDAEGVRDSMTPLGWAISYAQPDAALLLIEREANANATSRDGSTPLQSCAAARDLEDGDAARIAAALLQHGANPDARDICGNTALSLARHRKKSRLQEVLEAHGATE